MFPYPKIHITELLFKVQELFRVIKAINKISATNSLMNISHTLYVIPDAKAFCSILYSSGNIQTKTYWGPVDTPKLDYVHKNLSIQRVKLNV